MARSRVPGSVGRRAARQRARPARSSGSAPMTRMTGDRPAYRRWTDATVRARRFVPATSRATPAASASAQTSGSERDLARSSLAARQEARDQRRADDQVGEAEAEGDQAGTRQRPPDQSAGVAIGSGSGDRLHDASLRSATACRHDHSGSSSSGGGPIRRSRPHQTRPIVVAGRTGTCRGPATRLAATRTPVPLLTPLGADILDLVSGVRPAGRLELARRETSE